MVLVAHGGVMDCLYRAATRVPLDAPRIWQLDNAAINRLLHTSSGLTMVGWNDTSHLDVGAPTLDESADKMPLAAPGGAHRLSAAQSSGGRPNRSVPLRAGGASPRCR